MAQLKNLRTQLQDHEMIKRRENKRMIKRRKKKTYKRYARRKWTKNKSTIIGMVQLGERSQQQNQETKARDKK